MSNQIVLSGDPLPIHQIVAMRLKGTQIILHEDAVKRIRRGRETLEGLIADHGTLFYGINTGFGSLCDTRIHTDDLEALQKNLVRSHSVGVGDVLPLHALRLILGLKILGLVQGHSGVRLELVQRLVDMYNNDCLPEIFEFGSLGASGDLAPLAHLSLPLLGEGYVYVGGKRLPSKLALQRFNWQPLTLAAKEGLALINGTQFSTGVALGAWHEAAEAWRLTHVVAAMSLDGFACSLTPFDPRIHELRRHIGQRVSARLIRHLLQDSELAGLPKSQVQDPYSFRCIPQVHGACYDVLAHVAQVLENEANSVTDNPNVIIEEPAILSGGNFHAQPVAFAADYLALAVSELGSISERRVYQLISGARGLPVFLTQNPGLQSGFMIAQYTAAALAGRNKQLCTPASVDSLVSCNGQEDHVSMAANAATRLPALIENVRRILSIELLVAAQALEYRRPATSSPIIEQLMGSLRSEVPTLDRDRSISNDICLAYDVLFKEFRHDDIWPTPDASV